jgi:hypothetical protein
MKDVFTVKRSADGDDVLKQLNGQYLKVIDVSADTTLEDTDSGSLILWDASTNDTDIVLPACEKGLYFKIFITVAAHTTGGSTINTATNGETGAGNDYFFGSYTIYENDTANTSANQTVVKATAAAAPEDHDFIVADSNGTTTGGDVGSVIELYGTDNNGWFVNARMSTSGTPAETVAGIA